MDLINSLLGRNKASNDQTSLKMGFLKKQGGMMPNWKTRWFVLRAEGVHYYADQKDRVPKGIIPSSNIQLVGELTESDRDIIEKLLIEKVVSHLFVFQIKTPSRTYLCAANSANSRADWIFAIDKVRELYQKQATLSEYGQLQELIKQNELQKSDIIQEVLDYRPPQKLVYSPYAPMASSEMLKTKNSEETALPSGPQNNENNNNNNNNNNNSESGNNNNNENKSKAISPEDNPTAAAESQEISSTEIQAKQLNFALQNE